MTLEVTTMPDRFRDTELKQEGVWLLPERIEGDRGVYRSELEDLPPYFRAHGMDGSFLHDSDHRLLRDLKGVAEVSFGLSIALNIIGSAGWDAFKLGFRTWVGSLRMNPPLEIDIIIPTKDNDPISLHLSGDGEEVNEALDRLPETVRELSDAARKAK